MLKTTAIELPEELSARIREVSAKNGETRSAVMREALRKYFDGEKSHEDMSCLDFAGDIAGSLEGPSDISTNLTHLSGYGK